MVADRRWEQRARWGDAQQLRDLGDLFVALKEYDGVMNTASVHDLHSLVAQGSNRVTILDARTPEEFAEGHVPGAINIPFDQLPARAGELDAARPVHVYCRMGGRAQKAAASLEASGFAVCCIVGGGMDLWRASGFPVERTD